MHLYEPWAVILILSGFEPNLKVDIQVPHTLSLKLCHPISINKGGGLLSLGLLSILHNVWPADLFIECDIWKKNFGCCNFQIEKKISAGQIPKILGSSEILGQEPSDMVLFFVNLKNLSSYMAYWLQRT